MFKGMEYVYEVYKEKSFSKAAQNLYITQPSLSATIKKIEERLGTPIFDRSTVPVQLTPVGEEYIKSVEKIMDIEESFSNYLNDINQLKTGRVVIGASNFFASFILPPVINTFDTRYPAVEVVLREADTTSLENQLLQGALDLVMDIGTFNTELFSMRTLFEEQLILAAHKKFGGNKALSNLELAVDDIIMNRHQAEDFPCVKLDSFRDEPFLMLRSGNDTRIRADRICEAQGFKPKVALKLDQQITAYNLACYGMGIAFISDTLVRQVKPDPNMVYYKLDPRLAKRDVCFCYKHNRYVTKAMQELIRIAQETYSIK